MDPKVERGDGRPTAVGSKKRKVTGTIRGLQLRKTDHKNLYRAGVLRRSIGRVGRESGKRRFPKKFSRFV